MPRTEHNTVDDLFYPRSFGARNVVQDRSSRLRINLRQFHIHFFFVCAGLCNSTTGKPTRVRKCILGNHTELYIQPL